MGNRLAVFNLGATPLAALAAGLLGCAFASGLARGADTGTLKGKITQLGHQSFMLKSDDDTIVTCSVSPNRVYNGVTYQGMPPAKLEIRGANFATMLRAGMSVRFEALIDQDEQIVAPIQVLSVIAPLRDEPQGIKQPPIPGGVPRGPEPNRTTRSTVTGQLSAIRGGAFKVTWPGGSIQGILANDVEIVVINDWANLRVGDEAEVTGLLVAKNYMLASLVKVTRSEDGATNAARVPAKRRPVSERLPVPDDESQRAAVDEVRKIFRPEYEAATNAERQIALARKMLQVSGETNDDATARFVLARVARDIAVKAGDAETALEAIDLLAHDYDIDLSAMRAAALAPIARTFRFPKDHAQFALTVDALVKEAIHEDRYEAALQLNELVLAAARRGRNMELAAAAQARAESLAKLQSDFETVERAAATLEESPIDAEANLVLGKHLCFVKNDWMRGLPMLALGSDPQLRAIAARELEYPPTKPQALTPAIALELADAWWEIAENLDPTMAPGARNRSVAWYRAALPALSGLSKIKVEKRLEEAGAGNGPSQSP